MELQYEYWNEWMSEGKGEWGTELNPPRNVEWPRHYGFLVHGIPDPRATITYPGGPLQESNHIKYLKLHNPTVTN